jgi:hypothetical protein
MLWYRDGGAGVPCGGVVTAWVIHAVVS